MMLIALLAICFICFCVALTKWYAYLNDRGAVAYVMFTMIPAGFVGGFLTSAIGLQLGRKYLFSSVAFGVFFGFFSYFIFGIVSMACFRLFKPKSFREK